MAKIKAQKKKKVQKPEKQENEEVPLPSTRSSDDPIPNKVHTLSIYLRSFTMLSVSLHNSIY